MNAGGRIICTASISGRMGVARHAVYAASKAAIEGMVKSLAVELGPRGITVNAIVPGGVNTDMAMEHGRAYGGDYSTAPLSPEEVAGALKSVTPLDRGAVPEDIANAVALLVSADAEWISGQAIVATGGA
jgi:NAD(P)-dependent dehydrogenase (short-subunit alcohol dehydrogenase family)